MVVGMEMFDRSQQSVLDRWSQGQLTEEEFLKEVNWEATWGMDYQLYKGILDDIKDHHFKVLGLNIERDLVRKVAQNGIEGLSPEDKEKLPEMDLTDQAASCTILHPFTKAIMAARQRISNISIRLNAFGMRPWQKPYPEFVQSPEGMGKTVLVFAGSGHVVFDFGIPKRFYRRASIPYKTIVLKEWRKEMNGDLHLYGSFFTPGKFSLDHEARPS